MTIVAKIEQPLHFVNCDAMRLHNAVAALVFPLATWFKTKKMTPMLVVQPENLPRLSVFFLREVEASDGKAGEPHFLANLHLGITGSIVSSDDENQLLQLQTNMLFFRRAIFSNPMFRVQQGVEMYESTDTRMNFTRIGETPLAECQTEYVFSYRTDYPPELPDDLKQIVVQPVEGPDLINAGENYPYMEPRVYNIPSEDDTPISGGP
jgi:hypothetical protein